MEIRNLLAVRQMLALVLAAALLSGCSALPVELPGSGKLPEPRLGQDEQQRKIKAMIAKAQTHHAEAAKQIENGK